MRSTNSQRAAHQKVEIFSNSQSFIQQGPRDVSTFDGQEKNTTFHLISSRKKDLHTYQILNDSNQEWKKTLFYNEKTTHVETSCHQQDNWV